MMGRLAAKERGKWQTDRSSPRCRPPPARRRTLARAALQASLHEVAPLGQAASISACAPSRAVKEETVPVHEAGRLGNWARAAPRQPSATSSRPALISDLARRKGYTDGDWREQGGLLEARRTRRPASARLAGAGGRAVSYRRGDETPPSHMPNLPNPANRCEWSQTPAARRSRNLHACARDRSMGVPQATSQPGC